MKLRIFAAALTAAMILASCGSSEPADDISSAAGKSTDSSVSSSLPDTQPDKETDPESSEPETAPPDSSEPEPTLPPDALTPDVFKPREKTDLLNGCNQRMQDYTFTISAHMINNETGETETRERELTVDEDIAPLWEMLTAVETAAPEKNFDSVGGLDGTKVVVTPRYGGESLTVTTGIGYYNEFEEGGPGVLVFEGLTDEEGRDLVFTTVSMTDSGEEYSAGWLTDFCRAHLTTDADAFGKSNSPADSEEQKVVILRRFVNYAWGIDDHADILDSLGYLYNVELASGETYGEYEPPENEELIADLEKQISDGSLKPVGKAPEESVRELIKAAGEIDRNAPTADENLYANDAGQHTIYYTLGGILELKTAGDYNTYLDDPAAQDVCKRYMDICANAEKL